MLKGFESLEMHKENCKICFSSLQQNSLAASKIETNDRSTQVFLNN